MFIKQKTLSQQIEEINVSLRELVKVTGVVLDKLSDRAKLNDAADATWEPFKPLPPDAPPMQYAIIYPEDVPGADELDLLAEEVVGALKKIEMGQVDSAVLLLRRALRLIGIDPDTGNPLDDKEEKTHNE